MQGIAVRASKRYYSPKGGEVMTEDPTQKLPNSPSFEDRVLAELATIRSGQVALETRLTALEDKVDARLRETRPIWESVQQQLTELKAQVGAIEKTLDDIRLRLTEVYRDSFEIRGRIGRLEERERERERLSTG
jgi:chromosome segregation ATPase